jgi:DNA repair photolyase
MHKKNNQSALLASSGTPDKSEPRILELYDKSVSPADAEFRSIDCGDVNLTHFGPFIFVPWECQVWLVSLYRKCDYRCVYCSTESQGRSEPGFTQQEVRDWVAAFARVKNDNHALLSSGFSDPYVNMEREYRITRTLVESFIEHGLEFQLSTKSPIILDDLDLIANTSLLQQVCFSLVTDDEEVMQRLEPGGPSLQERVDAINALHEAGVPVFMNIGPWIPGISDIERLVARFPDDLPVKVSALCYQKDLMGAIATLFGPTKSSSEKVFGKQMSQTEIEHAFLDEYYRIGAGSSGNIKWSTLRGYGENFSLSMPENPQEYADPRAQRG